MVLDPAQVSLDLGNDPRDMTAAFTVKNSGATAFRYTVRLKKGDVGQETVLTSQIEITPSVQGVLQPGAGKELTVKYLPPFRPGLNFRLEVFASTMHEGDDDDPLEQGAQRAVGGLVWVNRKRGWSAGPVELKAPHLLLSSFSVVKSRASYQAAGVLPATTAKR